MGQTNFTALGLKQAGMDSESLFSVVLNATATIDPASLTTGSGATSSAITVTGAEFGDYVLVAAPYDLQGVRCFGYVSAADTVKVRFENNTGSTIDLDSGTYNIKVLRG